MENIIFSYILTFTAGCSITMVIMNLMYSVKNSKEKKVEIELDEDWSLEYYSDAWEKRNES